LVWTPTALGATFLLPGAVLFRRAWRGGAWTDDVIREPTKRRAKITGTLAVVTPLLTGLVDLFVRMYT
jgi:hypothetical protein